MFSIPKAAEPLSEAIRNVFTRPTFERFTALMMGLIVSMGRRTVSHALAVMEPVLEGHWSNYHRLYSSAKYSMWELAAVLVRQVVALLPADAVIELAADDTVDGKQGDHVWAKSAHRDSARSSGAKTNIKFGHKWLVMCVLVRLKGWGRPWALPILCGLCVSPKVSAANGIRPKTPSQLARQLLIQLMRWLPNRKFILIGDYQVVTHKTAEFARRHSDRVTAIGRLRGDANLYAPPVNRNRKFAAGGAKALPPHAKALPPQWIKKGRKIPSPAQQIQTLEPTSQNIAWYGGSRREMRLVSELALWHDAHGRTATPIRWVCVLGDAKSGLENAFFFCSDPAMDAARIVEYYSRRWNIEVTFEESRALLGLETTRHWCRQSVLRVTPILLGLFSVVVLIWKELPEACQQLIVSGTPCYSKSSVTFADVLGAVRRELWEQALLEHPSKSECLSQLPEKLRRTILWHLSAAA